MRIRRADDLCCPSTLLIFFRSLPRIDAALPSPPLAHAHCCNPPFIFLYSKVVCTLILYLSTDHSKNFSGLSHRKRRASPLVSHAFFSFSRPATVPYLVSRTHVFVLPSRLEHLRSSTIEERAAMHGLLSYRHLVSISSRPSLFESSFVHPGDLVLVIADSPWFSCPSSPNSQRSPSSPRYINLRSIVNDAEHVCIRTRHISSPAGNNVPTDGLEMALFGLISLVLRTLTSVWGPPLSVCHPSIWILSGNQTPTQISLTAST
jgi:hypothetical protein